MNTKEQRFSKLVKEYEQTIYAVCYMFSHDAEDVDDLHQEILIRLWQGYDGFEGRSDIKTWIYRVALNYCINFSNKRKREQTKHTTEGKSDTSDNDLEKRMQIKQLYQRINKLGFVDRSVILLWLEGLSYEEIGAIIGISVKNVSFKLVRIKERERNIVEELEELKTGYNALKAQMKQQERLNERFFKAARHRPVQAVNKKIRNRMILDVLTLPIIWIICIATHWPLLFGVLVSLWTMTDLGATIWINRKLGMDHLLDGDTRTVTHAITSYRRFYRRALTISIIPCIAMITYIFIELLDRVETSANRNLIIVIGIAYTLAAIIITGVQYRRHNKACDDLLNEFEE